MKLQELINYAKTLIPEEYKRLIRIPSLAASKAFYAQNTDHKEVIDLMNRLFETKSKSFQLYRKEELLGTKLLVSYSIDASKNNDKDIKDVFPVKNEKDFLREEKEIVKHNFLIALEHPSSELFKLIEKAKEEGITMSDFTKNSDDKSKQMKTWEEFLKAWPSDRVKSMQLSEYTNLDKDDSFCYWVESKTQNLGSIWGGSSYKFGIYKKNNVNKIDNRPGYHTDGEYAWVAKYGKDRDTAFESVKSEIVRIVEAAESNELEVVNHVNLGEAYKWKIAALYHKEIPLIYKPDAIGFLVKHFEKSAASASERYHLLAAQLLEGEDIIGLSWRLWEIYDPKDTSAPEDEKEAWVKRPLNQIFYGPPGTGKTYNTLNEAVKIVEQLSDEDFDQKYTDRKHLKSVFEEYVNRGQIAFTTFHQSMSYEDFIEGIKPKTHEIGEGSSRQITVSYEVEPGIFRKLCENAEGFLSTKKSIQETKQSSVTSEELEKAIFFKMSLGRAGHEGDQEIYNYCIKHNVIALGWGDDINFTNAKDETAIKRLIEENDNTKSAIPFLKHFRLYMKPGNFVVKREYKNPCNRKNCRRL
jgi:5-methylcytosine-specific restriction protein B